MVSGYIGTTLNKQEATSGNVISIHSLIEIPMLYVLIWCEIKNYEFLITFDMSLSSSEINSFTYVSFRVKIYND